MRLLTTLKQRLAYSFGRHALAVAAAVALASVISVPRTGVAQSDAEMDEAVEHLGGMGSSLRKSTVESMCDALNLSTEQRKSVLELFTSYKGQVRDAAKKFMEFEQNLDTSTTGMPSEEDMKKMMEGMQNFADHAQALEERFMEDFKITLTPEQAAQWPKVERRKRLSDATSGPMMGGSVVDLVAVARGVMPDGKLPPESAEAVDQYEQDLDAAVTDLLAWRKDLEKKLKKIGEELAGKSMQEQQEFGMKLMREMEEKARPASDVNDRSLPKLAAILPEDVRDRFQIAYYRAAYFQLFDQQGPQIEKGFDAALKLEGLTDEQRKAVADIRRSYEAETLSMLRSVSEQRAKEMKDASNPQEMWGGQSMREFYEKGPQIVKAALEKVRAALPADLLAKLPAPFKPAEVKELELEE